VVDAVSGAPVAGAAIESSDPRQSTISGADGRWVLDGLPGSSARIRFEKTGYSTRSLTVQLPTAAISVALSPEALPLEALVVTASRREQRLADAPVTTELITRREIDQAGASDLASALTERTGLQLEGGQPTGSGVMLQGFGSERVLILIDGQPLVGRMSGQLDLTRIPTSIVERVEVIKGPQSSLYGSDAMGGVVNIITRDPGEGIREVGAAVTAGTQGRADIAANLRGSAGPLAYTAEGGRRTTELTPGRAAETGALAERWDGMGRLSWSPASTLELAASALVLSERQRWQSGTLFNFADNVQRSGRVDARWSLPGSRLSSTLHLSDFEHLARQASAPAPGDAVGEREVQRLVEGELLYNRAWGRHALDLGVEAKRETTVSDRVQGRSRALHSLEPFVQSTWSFGGASLVPGARLAWSEQWGAHLTPRLAGLYRPIPELGLRASMGRGFRAPAFKELYMDFLNTGAGHGYAVRGNPDLRPENSTNLSAGAEWAKGPVYLRAQSFYNDFRDFIETRLVSDSSGVSIYTYGNISRGFTRGVELEGGLVRGGFRAEGGYGFLQARDTGADAPLLGRAAHSGRLTLENPLALGFRGALTGIFTGRTPVSRGQAGTVERDGFLRFDLRLSRPVPGGMALTVGAKNLFDARPASWPGFAGRHLYLGMSWNATHRSASSGVPAFDSTSRQN
jgi:outer membrane receptor for ferrienterochelin and colicins